MKKRIGNYIVALYDLVLAIGAIYNGGIMVLGLWWPGEEFPDVWLDKIPFRSWFWPGVIAILVYGLGNLIAAAYTFRKEKNGWIASMVMGIFFLVSLFASLYVLGEGYLATFMFMILAIIQILLSIIAMLIEKMVGRIK